MPKVYSYTRFSTPEQAKGDSFRRQTEAAEDYAKRHGLELDANLAIHDAGVSAFKGANLAPEAGLGRFITAIKEGLVEPGSILLLESLDRLSRGVPRRTTRLLEEIVDAGVVVVTLSDNQRYDQERLDNDPTGLIVALLVAQRGNEESKTKADRVANGWAEKRRRVRTGETARLTRRGPAWLVAAGDGWQIDEAKAEVVRRVYSLTLEGVGEHKIAETLNREGVPPLGRANLWHRSSIAKLLSNRAVIGDLTPGRIVYVGERRRRELEEPIPGAFPSIISEADWLAVRSLKDGQSGAVRGRAAAAPLANLLAGLARCPLCASAMTRVNKGSGPKGGRPKLVCTKAKAGAGCHYHSVPLDEVEGALVRGASRIVENIPAGEGSAGLDRQIQTLEGSIAGATLHLEDLADALEASPSASGAKRLTKLECEIDTMRAELEALQERSRQLDGGLIQARTVNLAEALEGASEIDPEALDRGPINAALRILFSGITVDYRTGNLLLHWKQGGETGLLYAWVKTG
ncbi:recombinase family protein [Sphingorhabdus soli]|uniref:Recombinase family protein n=1 Tax=Flavisphingopyxis soli TaxID=2601267 RepID=A0A5C6U9V0_9SPHN|nr:recombinase family protein [Sphingorhabdus soli]TXC68368.1 recombinase family protein [Sphingorhabdus soli]